MAFRTGGHEPAASPILSARLTDAGILLVRIAGDWSIIRSVPSSEEVERTIESASELRAVAFDTGALGIYDSGLLNAVVRILDTCGRVGVPVGTEGLPEGLRRLVRLARAVPERTGARKKSDAAPFFASVGNAAVGFYRSLLEVLAFLGESTVAVLRFASGRSAFRRADLSQLLRECGAQAMPIVSLISFLVGLILAFVGAIQLKYFGAQIYVADIVAIAMVRVMGAIMTGIIMAGRTGAAFAAQIGTMQVNEEIDALRTLGISPVEFLVVPRMVALIVMVPLLCLYADAMGILGGLVVGTGMLGLNPVEYLNRTQASLSLTTVWIGLFHSAVFGALVALAGCLRGMQCGRSASDVGRAATSAVVTGIVAIILATALITFMCEVLGI